MRFPCALLACVLGFSLPAARAAAQPAKKPNLVVLVTIDQFRADYLDRFGPQMHGGIARMMREGVLDLHERGSRLLWRLQIWRCEMPAALTSAEFRTS